MKKLLALMMALACLLLLCACSDKQPDADELDTQVYIASTANPEDKVLMSEEDANAILTLLFDGTWEQYAYLCNDTLVFTIAGQEMHYCYECGRFNDRVNDANYRVYDVQHKAIQQMAETYLDIE